MFVTASDGTSYDSQNYNNIKYTATGTGVGQTWEMDESTPLLLSSTKGKAYAYYPRQATGVSLNSITISNDGNDWMYTPSASSEVSMLNPTAQLEMKHAMTILRVKVVGANAYSEGAISSLTVDGNGWATSATLDLLNGTIGSYVGEGTQLAVSNLGTLNTTGVSHDFWVASNETASTISFRISVGGNDFVVSTPTEVTLDRGKVYNYTLKVETAKGAELSSLLLTDWTSEDTEMDTELDPWSRASDGVYAIDNAGNPMDYATAYAAPTGTYKGVALVTNGKAIEISADFVSNKHSWAATSPMTPEEQAHFSDNFITTLEAAKADMDGKANTDRILAANVSIASAINSYNDGSHGSTSWYLPSAGQYNNILINQVQIGNLLYKIGGNSFANIDYPFCTSSVYSANSVWAYDGDDERWYNTNGLTGKYWVRLVRDL